MAAGLSNLHLRISECYNYFLCSSNYVRFIILRIAVVVVKTVSFCIIVIQDQIVILMLLNQKNL